MDKKKSKMSDCLSFNIGEDELKNQIANYETLRINKSYRGISALIVFAICAVSVLAAFMLKDQITSMSGALIGIAIYSFAGLFILKGRRWAMIMAMILWSADKMMFIYQTMQAGGGGAFVVFFFWIVVMRFFWRALEVENYRKELADLMKEREGEIDGKGDEK